jgi:hypothetical protein
MNEIDLRVYLHKSGWRPALIDKLVKSLTGINRTFKNVSDANKILILMLDIKDKNEPQILSRTINLVNHILGTSIQWTPEYSWLELKRFLYKKLSQKEKEEIKALSLIIKKKREAINEIKNKPHKK